MRFSNQLPVIGGGQAGQKRGLACDGLRSLPALLVVVLQSDAGIELAEGGVGSPSWRRWSARIEAISARSARSTKVRRRSPGADRGGQGSSPRTCASNRRAPPTSSGDSRFSALCPSTAQSIPATAATRRRLSAGAPTWTKRHHDARAAGPQRTDRLARGLDRIARHDAGGPPAGGVGGRRRRADAEDPDRDPAGVDQPIGREQPLGRRWRRGWRRRSGILTPRRHSSAAGRPSARSSSPGVRARSAAARQRSPAGPLAARSRPGPSGRKRSPASTTSVASASARACANRGGPPRPVPRAGRVQSQGRHLPEQVR